MKNNHSFVILAYKESPYLEDAIKSVINQSIDINIIIATSTPNDYIYNLANKYNLKVIVNKDSKGIASDFDFACNCVDSKLLTIVHQDDIYEKDYALNIKKYYDKYNKSLILFTSYYEIQKDNKIYKSRNINVKKVLLSLLKIKCLSKFKFIKRSALRFGNAICCPSVTFCKNNIKINNIFESKFDSNMDWLAWERLSKEKGNFIYINKPLMGHRIHNDSMTSKLINKGLRGNEDLYMFKKFWPTPIAKIINRLYSNGEKDYK